jgi:hypothetical protein
MNYPYLYLFDRSIKIDFGVGFDRYLDSIVSIESARLKY